MGLVIDMKGFLLLFVVQGQRLEFHFQISLGRGKMKSFNFCSYDVYVYSLF